MGIRAAHAFDCSMVRIFTFSRVAEPESIFPRIADVIGEYAGIAEKEGIRLLIPKTRLRKTRARRPKQPSFSNCCRATSASTGTL